MGDTIDEMGFMIPLSRLFSGEVIEGLKVVPTVPASTSVTVQPGSAFIRTGAAPSHYAYPICLNTTGGETVALPAAQSQPMIVDIVAALDIPAIGATTDTNNPGTWQLVAVAGTPNAVPSPPTNGQVQSAVSSKPFIRLGRMTHNSATQSSGITAVTDIRSIVNLVTANIKTGVIEASAFQTLGDKKITGVGFKPRIVKFTLLPEYSNAAFNFAIGSMTDLDQFTATGASSTSGHARSSSTTAAFIFVSSSGDTTLRFERVSLDSDGFTVKVVTASSLFKVAYEAYA
ncbi:hypothetical protein [Dietzia cinnamea]|uniref:hypothetical protein n=1 Tax=Dietzia cinnamea TaxID=321318 RepID=UPI00223AB652|nr:hypothetical protein [Dietzia cinnamea]MCT2076065.1 hypothetical protein [Dietzia cinnamea]MCT2219794.1 hypothetical protein [Dietzia cinnamea]